MIALYKLKVRQFKNTIRNTGIGKYLFFLFLGIGILILIGFFFVKIFGFLNDQQEFPLVFKLFLSEKILMMVFLTLFMMLILSALISTLNIFFLSRDLNLLLASPQKSVTIFTAKAVETAVNSSVMVVFFSLPVLYAYCYYFAPRWVDILAVALTFLLYIITGVLAGIILGMIIPTFFSVRKLQPVLSLVSIALISFIVVFLRLLRPERFLNPEAIDNLMDYMMGLDIGFFSYFPFSWVSRAMALISRENWGGYLLIVGLFVIVLTLLAVTVYIFQKKLYLKLVDRLNESSTGMVRSSWYRNPVRNQWKPLWKKELKTFMRTPSQWSQLLIIGAMIMVFVLNMKSIPLPHPAVKNIIVYLNLGMAAFIGVGLNSRFTFTTIPMEGPGLVHVLASPFNRKVFFRFKLVFFAIPQLVIGFLLFYTGDISLKLDAFSRVTALFFLGPLLLLLTVLALFYGLQIKGSAVLTPQHLIVSRSGISYMLWSLLIIVLSMIYFIRPLFIYYFNLYRMRSVPFIEIFIWFSGFVLLMVFIGRFFCRRSLIMWLKREFL